MNKSNVAYLVADSYEQNDYGVQEKTQSKRKVYVGVSSVTGQEWFEGGRNGLNPQYRFTMFLYDYEGEDVIEFEGVAYTIYRTYVRNQDEIELYVEKRKGNEQIQEDTE